MNPATTHLPVLSPPRLPVTLQPSSPCPCCGGALIEADQLAEMMGENVRRIHGWLASPTDNDKMPARRPEHSTVPLWCLTAASVFGNEGADLMKGQTASKWSKSASTEILDAAENKVAWEHSHKIRLHWRVDGLQGKATLSGPGHRLEAQRLIDDIERAHVEGWARGADKRPIPPIQRPNASIEAALAGSGVDRTLPDSASVSAAPYDPRRTVSAAVDLRRTQIFNAIMEKKQKDDAVSALAFIERFLVYPEGHPQLAVLGIPAGSSFLLDDVYGLMPNDLEWFVQVRRTINMRVWNTFENKVKTWEYDCGVATRKAARTGVAVVLPDRPERPTEMKVKPRTEQYTWQILAQVLNVAMENRWITFNPYTTSVSNQVGVPAATAALAVRDVLTQAEVLEIASFIGQMTKTMKNPYTGKYEVVSGAKFALLVEVRGRLAPRNEEAVALFDDDFIDLDTANPFLRISGAEPCLPADPFGPDAAHDREPLKHRTTGVTRDVGISLDMVPRIEEHIARFSTENGRMFTSVFGAWLNINNWREHFWQPALDHVMRELDVPEGLSRSERRMLVEANSRRARLRKMDFYQLRHAAITAWLYDGVPVWEVAQLAGNSVEVINARYGGFIPKASRTSQLPVGSSAALTPETVRGLSSAEINAQIAILVSELSARSLAA